MPKSLPVIEPALTSRRLLSRRPLKLLTLVALFAAGCGSETYEERLANTVKLFAHMELLNAHLQRVWSDSVRESTVEFRPPQQFALIPPPEKPEKSADPKAKDEEPEPEVEPVDERQPKFLNVELPGIRGAWVAQLKTMTETNNSGEAQGYLYVLSNQHLGEDLDKAREFNATVFGALAESLHVFVEPNEWKEEKYPASPDTFATVRRYKAVLLKPGELIGGVETEFWIYQYEDGDVQVTVLYVLPKDVDRGEKMFERVPLSLETVNINGNRLGHQSGQNQRVGGSGDSGKKGL